MFDTVHYETHGNVALIALNRPDLLNSFTSELCNDLLLAIEKANSDDSIRSVVLTGEGRAFSAGADLKSGFEGDRTIEEKLQYEFRPIFSAIADIPKPVIAAVPGFAAGIGMSLALHADLVIMADDAFLLSPFTTISLVPDGGANWLLVRQLGYRRAFQLSVESERITAARCVELGLANKTAPADALREAAIAWGEALGERAPLSIAATKKVMRLANDADWAACFDVEAELQEQLRNSGDAEEGVAAFLEKRAPSFHGK
ncbi:MAG: enoyl-CoA hydratase/isomerase family protein [Gammaproteobacteria bacterium]|nr:enoyl-CoA hydratase/isomerase family protein [Gammaproteobacteria bacterium]